MRSYLCRSDRDQRGAAAFEFVCIAFILFAILFAVFDVGNIGMRQIALQAALRSGGEFGRFDPTQPGVNGGGAAPCAGATVRCAVLNALPSGYTLSSLNISCTCNAVAVSCSAPGACISPFLMKITASLPSVLIMTSLWPGGTGSTFTNQASYEVRIQ